MGWKSSKEIDRVDLEEKITNEILNNIEKLSDNTLEYILEIISEDENSGVDIGYNYVVKNNK